MRDPPLQPLRIPAHWTVSYTTFFELDPSEDVRQYLCEDLFQARCDHRGALSRGSFSARSRG